MNAPMTVEEALQKRNALDGRSVSIQGTLLAGFESSCLVSDPEATNALERGILISDPQFLPRLLDELPCYVGGVFAYQDFVEITGILKACSERPPFLARLCDIQKLEVRRQELDKTVHYSLHFSA
jgi:hypothetical protein